MCCHVISCHILNNKHSIYELCWSIQSQLESYSTPVLYSPKVRQVWKTKRWATRKGLMFWQWPCQWDSYILKANSFVVATAIETINNLTTHDPTHDNELSWQTTSWNQMLTSASSTKHVHIQSIEKMEKTVSLYWHWSFTLTSLHR